MNLLRGLFRLVTSVLRTAWRLVVVATPLLGLWLSSSLIAFFGGPRELTLLGGLLLFPLLPLFWEAWSARGFARRQAAAVAARRDPPRRILKALDRLTLRTLIVNGVFLGALFALYPRPAFTALATRGDWFLDGRDDDVSAQVRAGLFAAAGGLEWLHELANPNPYKKDGDDAPVPDDVKPIAEDRPDDRVALDDKIPKPPKAEPSAPDPTPPAWLVGDTHWPHAASIHPAVLAMRPEHEVSIAAVAQHLVAAEADPFLRVKALHDWTIRHLRYDEDSVTGVRKPQDAASVFNNRLGVCEGYARLLVALGQAADIPIEYVVGEVREQDGEPAPVGHAWNAVQVQGNWYFLDATWDDPIRSDGADDYQTDYLFTPPSVAIFDHLPDDPRWQLLAQPLDRGAFVRQPMAGPGFAKLGLTLQSPERPRVDAVGGAIDVVIDNPRQLFLNVKVAPSDVAGAAVDCLYDNGQSVRARCPLPQHGAYEVVIFSNTERYGTYRSVAALAVNSR